MLLDYVDGEEIETRVSGLFEMEDGGCFWSLNGDGGCWWFNGFILFVEIYREVKMVLDLVADDGGKEEMKKLQRKGSADAFL